MHERDAEKTAISLTTTTSCEPWRNYLSLRGTASQWLICGLARLCLYPSVVPSISSTSKLCPCLFIHRHCKMSFELTCLKVPTFLILLVTIGMAIWSVVTPHWYSKSQEHGGLFQSCNTTVNSSCRDWIDLDVHSGNVTILC